jgi:hypothetical protein
MPREGLEESARRTAGLEDQVVATRLVEEVPELQAGRAGPDDEVVDDLCLHADPRFALRGLMPPSYVRTPEPDGSRGIRG